LRQQFGLAASFLINHELTLSLAAFPDYATMNTENCACPAKLFYGQKPIFRDFLIDKAAQLCLLLVWLKLIDSETDSPAFYKKHFRQTIEYKIQPILATLTPPTCQFIDAYLLLIRANSTDFSTTTKMSGLLAKHIFQELCQESADTQNAITDITLLLGELITVADALLDLKKDIENQQYNPIIISTTENNSTLQQEYALLKTNYQQLVQTIVNLMRAANLSIVNPLFNEILQQSLHNLTHNIQRADNALFTANTNNQQNNSRNKKWCECADSCGDCGACDCSC
jgi:hypothetical protein